MRRIPDEMEALVPPAPDACKIGILDAIDDCTASAILGSWSTFCTCSSDLIDGGNGEPSTGPPFVSAVHSLCNHGLDSLAFQHFLLSLEEKFEQNATSKFWKHFDVCAGDPSEKYTSIIQEHKFREILRTSLEEISIVKKYQEKCLSVFIQAIQSREDVSLVNAHDKDAEKAYMLSKYHLAASSILTDGLPPKFNELLHQYFKESFQELNVRIEREDTESEGGDNMDIDKSGLPHYRTGAMDVDDDHQNYPKLTQEDKLMKNIGNVVLDLINIGFSSMAEDAYTSAIFLILKAKIQDMAGDDYTTFVLDPVKSWIQDVPLRVFSSLFAFLDDHHDDSSSFGLKWSSISHLYSSSICTDIPSQGLSKWKLRLEDFACETLQDLRISKLFDIIVDYPDSSPAIEDLKRCLDYTGKHSKLIDSFISTLRYRLLTAGASTSDILHQYVSTVKALRIIDPSGVFLEMVGEPIREYLRGRKDTIKCVVTMLTMGSTGINDETGGMGDSLLEEINKDGDNRDDSGTGDDDDLDDHQAWINAQRWEPDPVEAGPWRGGSTRKKIDVLGMVVGIIGSKDQLVSEYRVMLAEKLLNKSDYDISSEIRTLELLKMHFGESSLQKCEIMLNDLIDSKRNNNNIKATLSQESQFEFSQEEEGRSLEVLDATIISSIFWPPIQNEELKVPTQIEQLLSDYARRFNEIKAPRKLMWKKNLGTVKLELQFEDRSMEFNVSPVHATIIMHFQNQTRWTSSNLAEAVGVPSVTLNRWMHFWMTKGIISQADGDHGDLVFTLVDGKGGSAGVGGRGGDICDDELLGGEDSVAPVEDQLLKEMTVYEKFITGMLTNFGTMTLGRIHNTLKMFCVSEPSYDKSLQQLQSFLMGLVSAEKLQVRDGTYSLKK